MTVTTRAITEVAFVIAGWLLAQPLMTIVGHPISGPVMYTILAGMLIGGALHIAGRIHRAKHRG